MYANNDYYVYTNQISKSTYPVKNRKTPSTGKSARTPTYRNPNPTPKAPNAKPRNPPNPVPTPSRPLATLDATPKAHNPASREPGKPATAIKAPPDSRHPARY